MALAPGLIRQWTYGGAVALAIGLISAITVPETLAARLTYSLAQIFLVAVIADVVISVIRLRSGAAALRTGFLFRRWLVGWAAFLGTIGFGYASYSLSGVSDLGPQAGMIAFLLVASALMAAFSAYAAVPGAYWVLRR